MHIVLGKAGRDNSSEGATFNRACYQCRVLSPYTGRANAKRGSALLYQQHALGGGKSYGIGVTYAADLLPFLLTDMGMACRLVWPSLV